MSSITRTAKRRKKRENNKKVLKAMRQGRPLSTRDIRLIVSRNRLTASRLKRMSIPELNTTANVLKAIYNGSTAEDVRKSTETTIAYIFQLAREKASIHQEAVTNGE